MGYEVSGRQSEGYAKSASIFSKIGDAISSWWQGIFKSAPLGVSVSNRSMDRRPKISGPLLSVENPARLNRDELRVCLLLSQLLSPDAIEEELAMPAETVRMHLKNICRKTRSLSLAELTHCLLEPDCRVSDQMQARRLLTSAPTFSDWEIAKHLRA